jgi:hypothetical protein
MSDFAVSPLSSPVSDAKVDKRAPDVIAEQALIDTLKAELVEAAKRMRMPPDPEANAQYFSDVADAIFLRCGEAPKSPNLTRLAHGSRYVPYLGPKAWVAMNTYCRAVTQGPGCREGHDIFSLKLGGHFDVRSNYDDVFSGLPGLQEITVPLPRPGHSASIPRPCTVFVTNCEEGNATLVVKDGSQVTGLKQVGAGSKVVSRPSKNEWELVTHRLLDVKFAPLVPAEDKRAGEDKKAHEDKKAFDDKKAPKFVPKVHLREVDLQNLSRRSDAKSDSLDSKTRGADKIDGRAGLVISSAPWAADIDFDDRTLMPFPMEGAVVRDPGWAAEAMDLRPNDIIIECNGKPVFGKRSLRDLLRGITPGRWLNRLEEPQSVKSLVVKRTTEGGRVQKITLTRDSFVQLTDARLPGLRKGDAIATISSVRHPDRWQVETRLAARRPGQLVEMQVIRAERDGKQTGRFIDLIEIPLGAAIEGLPENKPGALVREVQSTSRAKSAGLTEGDLITHINREKVRSARDVALLLNKAKPGSNVELTITRPGKRGTLTLTLGEWPLTRGYCESQRDLHDLGQTAVQAYLEQLIDANIWRDPELAKNEPLLRLAEAGIAYLRNGMTEDLQRFFEILKSKEAGLPTDFTMADLEAATRTSGRRELPPDERIWPVVARALKLSCQRAGFGMPPIDGLQTGLKETSAQWQPGEASNRPVQREVWQRLIELFPGESTVRLPQAFSERQSYAEHLEPLRGLVDRIELPAPAPRKVVDLRVLTDGEFPLRSLAFHWPPKVRPYDLKETLVANDGALLPDAKYGAGHHAGAGAGQLEPLALRPVAGEQKGAQGGGGDSMSSGALLGISANVASVLSAQLPARGNDQAVEALSLRLKKSREQEGYVKAKADVALTSLFDAIEDLQDALRDSEPQPVVDHAVKVAALTVHDCKDRLPEEIAQEWEAQEAAMTEGRPVSDDEILKLTTKTLEAVKFSVAAVPRGVILLEPRESTPLPMLHLEGVSENKQFSLSLEDPREDEALKMPALDLPGKDEAQEHSPQAVGGVGQEGHAGAGAALEPAAADLPDSKQQGEADAAKEDIAAGAVARKPGSKKPASPTKGEALRMTPEDEQDWRKWFARLHDEGVRKSLKGGLAEFSPFYFGLWEFLNLASRKSLSSVSKGTAIKRFKEVVMGHPGVELEKGLKAKLIAAANETEPSLETAGLLASKAIEEIRTKVTDGREQRIKAGIKSGHVLAATKDAEQQPMVIAGSKQKPGLPSSAAQPSAAAALPAAAAESKAGPAQPAAAADLNNDAADASMWADIDNGANWPDVGQRLPQAERRHLSALLKWMGWNRQFPALADSKSPVESAKELTEFADDVGTRAGWPQRLNPYYGYKAVQALERGDVAGAKSAIMEVNRSMYRRVLDLRVKSIAARTRVPHDPDTKLREPDMAAVVDGKQEMVDGKHVTPPLLPLSALPPIPVAAKTPKAKEEEQQRDWMTGAVTKLRAFVRDAQPSQPDENVRRIEEIRKGASDPWKSRLEAAQAKLASQFAVAKDELRDLANDMLERLAASEAERLLALPFWKEFTKRDIDVLDKESEKFYSYDSIYAIGRVRVFLLSVQHGITDTGYRERCAGLAGQLEQSNIPAQLRKKMRGIAGFANRERQKKPSAEAPEQAPASPANVHPSPGAPVESKASGLPSQDLDVIQAMNDINDAARALWEMVSLQAYMENVPRKAAIPKALPGAAGAGPSADDPDPDPQSLPLPPKPPADRKEELPFWRKKELSFWSDFASTNWEGLRRSLPEDSQDDFDCYLARLQVGLEVVEGLTTGVLDEDNLKKLGSEVLNSAIDVARQGDLQGAIDIVTEAVKDDLKGLRELQANDEATRKLLDAWFWRDFDRKFPESAPFGDVQNAKRVRRMRKFIAEARPGNDDVNAGWVDYLRTSIGPDGSALENEFVKNNLGPLKSKIDNIARAQYWQLRRFALLKQQADLKGKPATDNFWAAFDQQILRDGKLTGANGAAAHQVAAAQAIREFVRTPVANPDEALNKVRDIHDKYFKAGAERYVKLPADMLAELHDFCRINSSQGYSQEVAQDLLERAAREFMPPILEAVRANPWQGAADYDCERMVLEAGQVISALNGSAYGRALSSLVDDAAPLLTPPERQKDDARNKMLAQFLKKHVQKSPVSVAHIALPASGPEAGRLVALLNKGMEGTLSKAEARDLVAGIIRHATYGHAAAAHMETHVGQPTWIDPKAPPQRRPLRAAADFNQAGPAGESKGDAVGDEDGDSDVDREFSVEMTPPGSMHAGPARESKDFAAAGGRSVEMAVMPVMPLRPSDAKSREVVRPDDTWGVSPDFFRVANASRFRGGNSNDRLKDLYSEAQQFYKRSFMSGFLRRRALMSLVDRHVGKSAPHPRVNLGANGLKQLQKLRKRWSVAEAEAKEFLVEMIHELLHAKAAQIAADDKGMENIAVAGFQVDIRHLVKRPRAVPDPSVRLPAPRHDGESQDLATMIAGESPSKLVGSSREVGPMSID